MYRDDYSVSEQLVYLADKVAELEDKVEKLEEDLSPDVVEVVRCKDCKYREPVKNCMFGDCIFAASLVADDEYCSNGERKEQEHEL